MGTKKAKSKKKSKTPMDVTDSVLSPSASEKEALNVEWKPVDLSRFEDHLFTPKQVAQLVGFESDSGRGEVRPGDIANLLSRFGNQGSIFEPTLIGDRRGTRGFSLKQLFYVAVVNKMTYEGYPYGFAYRVCYRLEDYDFIDDINENGWGFAFVRVHRRFRNTTRGPAGPTPLFYYESVSDLMEKLTFTVKGAETDEDPTKSILSSISIIVFSDVVMETLKRLSEFKP